MSWNDEPDYTPQFKWRDLLWVALFFVCFVGFMAVFG